MEQAVMSDIIETRTQADPQWSAQRLAGALRERLRGPGGYYNVGNLIGLGVSLVAQFFLATGGPPRSGSDILVGYFAGSSSAVALTAATVIFLVSGEVYHRAWAGRATPDENLNRLADILSAIGALALTVSLVLAGQLLLGIASGLLIAGGKLGSAVTGDDRSRLVLWPGGWIDPFRGAVLLGRLPGIAAVAIELGFRIINQRQGTSLGSFLQPAVLLFCYLLWVKADLLLMQSAVTTQSPKEASDARTQ
jgi:hypothetical protein